MYIYIYYVLYLQYPAYFPDLPFNAYFIRQKVPPSFKHSGRHWVLASGPVLRFRSPKAAQWRRPRPQRKHPMVDITRVNMVGLHTCVCVCFFPTCQVRVVRFYQSCSSPPSSSSASSSSSTTSASTSTSTVALPTLGQALPQLRSSVRTAGPQPGTSPAQKPDRMPEDMPDRMSDRMREDMPDKMP